MAGIERTDKRATAVALLAFLLLVTSALLSPASAEEAISGARQLRPSTVRSWLSQIGDRSLAERAKALQERYRREGYYDALVTADSVGSPTSPPALHIQEGPLVEFGAVELRTSSAREDDSSPFQLPPVFSGAASQKNIETGLAALVRGLGDAGYPGARVAATDFQRQGNRLSFVVELAAGPPARVEAWRITGLARSDSSRVRKLLGLRTGAVWNRAERERIQDRLADCEYVILAGEIRAFPGTEDSLAEVQIPLAERPAVVTDGGLGLAGGGTGTQSLRGRLHLTVDNPFGDGRRMELLVSRPTSGVAESRLTIADPHVGGSLIGAELDLRQFRQHDTYDRLSLGLRGWAFAPRGHRLGIWFGWSKITPVGGGAGAAPARSYEVELFARKRRAAHPARFTYTNWEVGAAGSLRREFHAETGRGADAQSRARVHLTVDHTRKLRRNVELRLVGTVQTWLGPDAHVRWGDELALGGPETLRGYPERALSSRGFGVVNAELGYRPRAPFLVFLFGDLARYRPFPPAGAGAALPGAGGYGIGVELSTSVGKTRVELGWPDHGEVRDGILSLRWLRGW